MSTVSVVNTFPSTRGAGITFTACVEAGRYEAMAVRMVESLRLFGGVYADAPVVTITPRLGPSLSRTTRQSFATLGVTHLTRRNLHRSWNRFIGKVWGLSEIEKIAETDVIVLLDCDILFLGEPIELALPASIGVSACHPDDGIVGTTGPSSSFEPAWRSACTAVGLEVDQLPWVHPYDGSPPVRFYLNSGVVAFRRGTGFPQQWLTCVDALLDRHVAFPGWGDYFADQVALGLAIVRYGLPWRPLPYSHNYGVANLLPEAWTSAALADARILHYHDQLLPENWQSSLDSLANSHPKVARWLQSSGPITESVTPPAKAIRFALRIPRAATRRVHRLRGWLDGRRGRHAD
jgi:hypothetical protein